MDALSIGAGMRAQSSTDDAPRVSAAQLPLAMVSEGDVVSVAKLRGSAELRQLLAELGFVAGAEVKVVSRVGGDVVVSVKGATFGINRDMAMRIVTC
jgi:ferrous iron transport protein A